MDKKHIEKGKKIKELYLVKIQSKNKKTLRSKILDFAETLIKERRKI